MGNAAAIPLEAPPAGGPPLLVSVNEAAHLCGVGRSLFYGLLAAGQVGPRPIRLGHRVLFEVEGLRRWCAAGAPPRHLWEAAERSPGARRA